MIDSWAVVWFALTLIVLLVLVLGVTRWLLGDSLGKAMLGIRVVDAQGEPAGYWRGAVSTRCVGCRPHRARAADRAVADAVRDRKRPNRRLPRRQARRPPARDQNGRVTPPSVGGHTGAVTAIIDSDQHLYESRTLWLDHIDPEMRDEALRIEDDDPATPGSPGGAERLGIADVQLPGDTAPDRPAPATARARRARRVRLRRAAARDYWEPGPRPPARRAWASTRRCCSRTTGCSGSGASRSRCRR